MKIGKAVLTFVVVLLAAASGCSAQKPGEYRVRSVIDGDTIELSNAKHVRYLGIDTPETRKRRGGVWVFVPEPYSTEAKKLNEVLVRGKVVSLEFDAERRDKYGRWLAYVWSGGTMVNEELLRSGLASVYTFPPNVKYFNEMVNAQKEAMQAGRGIWGGLATISPQEGNNYIGRYVRVRGEIADVNYARNRIYINFGRNYGTYVSGIIYKSNLVFFEKAGINPSSLRGKRAEIVGKVRDRNGPRIILDNPSQLRIIP